MNDGLISPHWYRVAKLKPKLHSHIKIHRHGYRGLIWYLLEDTTTGRNHRFNPAAYQFIGMLDGENAVQQIYDRVVELLDEFAPGQEEIIDLLSQLYAADLIYSDAQVNTEELFDRQKQNREQKIKQRFANPVAQKIPLWDPEDFLNRSIDKIRWIFSLPVALLWLFLVSYAVIQASMHWTQISQHFAQNSLSPYSLILMFVLYPPIKLLHELGHAYSAKLEGGEVHEMGINILMFIPIPYVNVSTATHFRSKYKRMLVSSAGILVETFLASLGLLLFLATEPGLVQSIGFNIFLIGGVSSLFFNGNPLLKYDGYYILIDAICIPNLYQRAAQYWQYFFQRYLFGLKQVSSPANAPGETAWFIGYSIASQLYRLGILWFIITFVAEKFFYVGLLLAFWLASQQIFKPLFKSMMFVFTSAMLNKTRGRALLGSACILATVVVIIGFMPVPSYTLSEGVVWQQEETLIKVDQDGFASAAKFDNNAQVKSGDAIIQLQNPFLSAEMKIAQARLNEYEVQYRAEREKDLVQASIHKASIEVAKSELQHIHQKSAATTISTARDGQLLIPDIEDLPGQYLRQGDLLGYVIDGSLPTVRVAVDQNAVGKMRKGVEDVEIRFASQPERVFKAKILREFPGGTNAVPSAALSTSGGGKFTPHPEAKNQLQVVEKVFLFDLSSDAIDQQVALGTRAYVRFHHGSETIADQLFREIRQVFLRQLNV